MAQILFKNAKLLDPHADAIQGGFSVLVEGESIREVSAKPINAANADVIDCQGRTLMPGLIDATCQPQRAWMGTRASGAGVDVRCAYRPPGGKLRPSETPSARLTRPWSTALPLVCASRRE